MDTQKREINIKRAEIAFFQILVLMFGIVAFSCLVSGAVPDDQALDSGWKDICNAIVLDKSPSLNINQINQLSFTPTQQIKLPHALTNGMSLTTINPNMAVSVADIVKPGNGYTPITENQVVTRCQQNNPLALKKLDDDTFLKGLRDNLKSPAYPGNAPILGEECHFVSNPKDPKYSKATTNFGFSSNHVMLAKDYFDTEDFHVTGENFPVSDEIKRRLGSENFLNKFNSQENDEIRRGWMTKLGILSDYDSTPSGYGPAAPQIVSFNKDKDILKIKTSSGLESEVNVGFREKGWQTYASNIKQTILKNGDIKLFNGAVISKSTQTIDKGSLPYFGLSFDQGTDMVLGKGTSADLTKVDFSSIGSDIKVKGDGGVLTKGTDSFVGQFDSGVVGNRGSGSDGYFFKDFAKVKDMTFDEGGFGKNTFTGDKLTFRGEDSLETFNGNLNGISSSHGIFTTGDAGVLNQKYNINDDPNSIIFSPKGSYNINDDPNSPIFSPNGKTPLDIKVNGNANGEIKVPWVFGGGTTISTENAVDGKLSLLGFNGEKIEITNQGVVEGANNLADVIPKDGELDISHKSIDGKTTVTDVIKSDGNGGYTTGTKKDSITKPTGKDVKDVAKSGLDKSMDSLKGALPMIALLAAVGGVAYFLLKGKDDKKDTSSTSTKKK